MENRLTEVCLSPFNSNGTIRKTGKHLLQTFMNFDFTNEHVQFQAAIIDMGFIWRVCCPSSEDREFKLINGEVITWDDYALRIFTEVLKRHKNTHEIHFINDRYDMINTIKDAEHQRRSEKFTGVTKNIFIKPNDKLPSKTDLSAFFKNPGNKIRLQEFLMERFQTYIAMNEEAKNLEFYYTLKEKCYNLKTKCVVNERVCHQIEADTRIFFHAKYISAQEEGMTPISIDAEDTDVICLSLYASTKFNLPLFLYKNGKYCNCINLLPPHVSNIILQLHFFSGSDCTSSFFNHGKKSIYPKLIQQDAISKLESVGDSLPITDNILNDLRELTKQNIYKIKDAKSMGEARAIKYNRLNKKNTSLIPPDDDSLTFHSARTNYITWIFKIFHCQTHQSLLSIMVGSWMIMVRL